MKAQSYLQRTGSFLIFRICAVSISETESKEIVPSVYNEGRLFSRITCKHCSPGWNTEISFSHHWNIKMNTLWKWSVSMKRECYQVGGFHRSLKESQQIRRLVSFCNYFFPNWFWFYSFPQHCQDCCSFSFIYFYYCFSLLFFNNSSQEDVVKQNQMRYK